LGYVEEQVFVPPLPLDIDELKLRITAVTETIGKNMLENAVSWITDWTFVGSRMELTFSTFRAGKTFPVFLFKWHEFQLYSWNTHLGVTN
jgi:hypothetical protein